LPSTVKTIIKKERSVNRMTTFALFAGLALSVPATARAEGSYTIKTLIKVGDMAGDTLIPKNYAHSIVGLSDRGLLIDAAFYPNAPPSAVQSGNAGETWIQQLEGKFTTIIRPGGPSPSGIWPKSFLTNESAMAPRGTVIFQAFNGLTSDWLGIYRYDPDTAQISPLVKNKTPASEGLTVSNWVFGGLAINNLNDMVLTCQVRTADLHLTNGLFLVGRDGRWQPIIVGEQEIPGWGIVQDEGSIQCVLNDAGMVAFLARRKGEKQDGAFLWEQGKISPLLAVGTDVPGAGKIAAVGGVEVNNLNRDVLIAAELENASNHAMGIYRLSAGKLTPLVVPGQAMPDGGVFLTLRFVVDFSGNNAGHRLTNGLGATNQKGQTAFLASMQDSNGLPYQRVVLVFRRHSGRCRAVVIRAPD
jgi:hypothetical protein